MCFSVSDVSFRRSKNAHIFNIKSGFSVSGNKLDLVNTSKRQKFFFCFNESFKFSVHFKIIRKNLQNKIRKNGNILLNQLLKKLILFLCNS